MKGSTYQFRSTLSRWIACVEVGRQLPAHSLHEGTWYWKGRPDPFFKRPQFTKVGYNDNEWLTQYSAVIALPGDILWYRYENEYTEGAVIVHR
ncbi:hypothetical protein AN963_20790 [Brevibacillus choshinensis]|uniref:Uncharacterized protein n=1 Tax=Brevibacillus choshinensis TaxID=54911 RepID=A0ABR5N069_BRECH|nr:hypothetical protein AN963_20790 [Brevibacillus choshinensis]